MRTFRALLLTEIRNYSRDWATLFFTLLFPLIFVLLFGVLMGGIGDIDQAVVGVLVTTDADFGDELIDLLLTSGVRSVKAYTDASKLGGAVEDHVVDFGLRWDGSTLHTLYDASRLQENFAFQQLAEGIAADFDLLRQGAMTPIQVQRIHAGDVEITSWFHLVLPGILAFSVLTAGLFAVSGHLTQMKERSILDRLLVTPMRPTALLVAIAAVRLVIVFLSTLITLFVGILVFGMRFDVDWLRYCIFVVCATFGTMGMGTVIALLVKRPSSAGNIANAMAMVMLFMAGVYFPIEFMPQSLQAASRAMPLTHMAEAMRYVTGVQEMGDLRFWLTSMVFAIVGLVLFPLLARYVVKPSRR